MHKTSVPMYSFDIRVRSHHTLIQCRSYLSWILRHAQCALLYTERTGKKFISDALNDKYLPPNQQYRYKSIDRRLAHMLSM